MNVYSRCARYFLCIADKKPEWIDKLPQDRKRIAEKALDDLRKAQDKRSSNALVMLRVLYVRFARENPQEFNLPSK